MLRRYFDSSGKTPVELYHSKDHARKIARARAITGRGFFFCLCLAPLQNKRATCNRSGARRRSLLLSFMPEHTREIQDSCRAVRNVRMDNSEVFVSSRSV